jgi:signal transduction histidine kinase
LGLPLIARGQWLGVVFIAFIEAHTFSPNDVVRGEQATQQVALAVAQARLFNAITVEHSHFQALIESSWDGIILVGLDRRILVVNAPALTYLQLPGRPEDWTRQLIRTGLRHVHARAPQAVRVLLEEFQRIETGDEPPAEGEIVLPPRTLRWLNLPVRADTTVLGRLLVVRDVTQQHQLTVLRDELTHMMVHDLRSPLSTVSTALEFLESDVTDQLDEEQQQTLAIARESVRFTLDLVNAILDVHQLESGQIALERLPIPLTHLVAEALRLQTPAASARNLTLLSDVPEALPSAWADPSLMSRVLQNLVNNAIKFTPPGGRVQVTAMVESSERPHLIVTVRDTGPGIPSHIQSRLFQKFVSERPAQGGRRGSGLGLAFCKLVVEAHGGRIWAESWPGRGTQFIFTVPVAPMESSLDAHVEPGD